jgi:hypothetical protein
MNATLSCQLEEAMKPAPAKTRKWANQAVEQARLLIGTGHVGTGSLYMRPKDEERIQKRIDRLIKKILAVPGVTMDYNSAHEQIFTQAKKLGGKMAQPGKDI